MEFCGKAQQAVINTNKASAREELQIALQETILECGGYNKVTKDDIVGKLRDLSAVCDSNGELYEISYKGFEYILTVDNEIVNADEMDINTIEFTVESKAPNSFKEPTGGEIKLGSSATTVYLYMTGGIYNIEHNAGEWNNSNNNYLAKFTSDNGEIASIQNSPYTIEEKGVLQLNALAISNWTITITDKNGKKVNFKNLSSCKISFDLNGGVGRTPETIRKEVGGSSGLLSLPKEVDATKEGYFFAGWSTDADSQIGYGRISFFYLPYGVIYKTNFDDVKLYAVWVKDDGRTLLGEVTTSSVGAVVTNKEDGSVSLEAGPGTDLRINLEEGYELEITTTAGKCSISYNGETIATSSGPETEINKTYQVTEKGTLLFSSSGGTVNLRIKKDGNTYTVKMYYV